MKRPFPATVLFLAAFFAIAALVAYEETLCYRFGEFNYRTLATRTGLHVHPFHIVLWESGAIQGVGAVAGGSVSDWHLLGMNKGILWGISGTGEASEVKLRYHELINQLRAIGCDRELVERYRHEAARRLTGTGPSFSALCKEVEAVFLWPIEHDDGRTETWTEDDIGKLREIANSW